MKNKRGTVYRNRYIPAAVLAAWTVCSPGCEKKEEAPKEVVRPAKIMTVTEGEAGWKRDFPAEIQAAQRADLAFNVSGTLTQLKVKEGQEVKAGTLIASLDNRDFVNNLAAVRAKLNAAESQYNRQKQLFEQNVTTKSELEFHERQFKVQQAEIQIAEKKVADTQLKAPFNGRIAKRYVDNHQEVTAKQPIVSLQDMSSYEVVVHIPENVIAPVKKRGKIKAFVKLPSLPDEKIELKLKELAAEADPQTRTYRVVLTMPAVEGTQILPGMTAVVTGEAEAAEGPDAEIIVPIAAVGTDADGSRFVWKLDDGMRAHKTPVKVGALKGAGAVISKGLKSNNRIITAGINDVTEGQKVRDLPSSEGGEK